MIKTIEIWNYKVRYYENGEGEPLLLIHGLGGSAESWIYNRDEFSKYFHTLAVDLLGFGFSDKPKIDYTIDMFVRFIKEFLDHLLINKVKLVGSSLGGQIAAEFTIKYASMVDKLVLVSPAGVTPVNFKGTNELFKYTTIFESKDIEELREKLAVLNDNVKISDDYLNFIYNYIKMDNAKYAFNSTLRYSSKAKRLTDRLDKINAKTLVIWGKNDKIIPLKYCKPFINNEKFRVILLEECGHRPHVEKSKIFNKLVIDFFNE